MSAFGVEGRLYVQMSINKVDIPLSTNLLDSLHLVESVRIGLPMLTFRIADSTKFLTRNDLLLDGAQIELTIETEASRSTLYFRYFNSEEDINGSGNYLVSAYLDAPRYWTESAVEPFRGSASAVLKFIAEKTGLTYSGVTTADTQIWVPANTKYKDWARDVSERAWVGERSCCVLGVTASKEMRMRDLSTFSSDPVVQLFSNKDNSNVQTVITDFKVINNAGFYNAVSGYKDKRIAQSLVTDSIELRDLKVSKNSTKLMMSRNIQSNIGQSRVTYAPIDVGNVSDTYERSRYQNRRLSSLFSSGLEIMTPRPVKANLLDVVNCEIAKPELDGVEQSSGKYLVTSKVWYIRGFNLYHKLEVLRHGVNTKDQGMV